MRTFVGTARVSERCKSVGTRLCRKTSLTTHWCHRKLKLQLNSEISFLAEFFSDFLNSTSCVCCRLFAYFHAGVMTEKTRLRFLSVALQVYCENFFSHHFPPSSRSTFSNSLQPRDIRNVSSENFVCGNVFTPRLHSCSANLAQGIRIASLLPSSDRMQFLRRNPFLTGTSISVPGAQIVDLGWCWSLWRMETIERSCRGIYGWLPKGGAFDGTRAYS